MQTFHAMGLHPTILESLDKFGFVTPTPIQSGTILLAIQGKDVLGSAKTGTGKTFAFAIPLITHLLENPTGAALVLAPTRELAQQVEQAIRQLISSKTGIKTALLIGGEPIAKQFSQLRGNPRVVIGTPGRIIDHLQRKTFKGNTTTFLVLDETDRMFDMGFGVQLEHIMDTLPEKRQTVMFSATFPPKIESLAAEYLNDPQRVFMDEDFALAENLTQETIKLKESEKYETLLQELNKREGSIIVFVKTKFGAEKLSVRLAKENHNASAIHGDLRQNKRERVMQAFRQGRYRILVATDVAARGLDVPSVKHVINYDMPHAPEDYIHRIGRTARAGESGAAVNFLAADDNRRWTAIQRLLNPVKNDGQDNRAPHTLRRNRSEGRSGEKRDPFGNGKSQSRDSWASRESRGGFGGERRAPRADGGGESRGSFGGERRAPRPEGGFGGERRAPRAAGGFSGGFGGERRAPRADSGGESRGSFGGEKRAPRTDGDFRVVSGERRAPRPEGGFGGERRAPRADGGGESRGSFGGEKRAPRAAGGFSGGFGGERRAPRADGESRGGFGERAPRAAGGFSGGFGGERRAPRAEGESRGSFGGERRAPRVEGGESRGSFGGGERRAPRAEGSESRGGFGERAPRAAGGFSAEGRAPRPEGESRGSFGAKKPSFGGDDRKPGFGKAPVKGFGKAPGKFGAKPARKTTTYSK